MGSLSIWHWLIVGAVLLMVFGGRGKISDLMGDVAQGIKAFRKGMSEDDKVADKSEPKAIDNASSQAASRPSDVGSKAV